MAEKDQFSASIDDQERKDPTIQESLPEGWSSAEDDTKQPESKDRTLTAEQEKSTDPTESSPDEEAPHGPITFAALKEQSASLKTKPHRMKLKKNGIVLYRGKEEGHPSDINIAYKNILQLRFSPAKTMRSGFLVFATKDASTRKVFTLADAVHSKHAVLFSKKSEPQFRAFAKATERFLKNMNPKFEGLVMMEKEEGYVEHAKEQEQKKLLAQYKKDGIIYCPKCFSTSYTKVHPAQKKGKLKHESELLRCKECGHKWHVK